MVTPNPFAHLPLTASMFGLLCVLLPLPALCGTLEGHAYESDQGHYRMTVIEAPAPLPVNRIHSWRISLQDSAGVAAPGAHITLTGGMPDHDHGLPTAPRVTAELSRGSYLVEGLKFHMNGVWILTFDIEQDGQSDSLTIEFTLQP